MSDLKRIFLCADDFGLNPGVCEGLLKLAHKQRLSAVSCMVNTADFIPYAQKLSSLAEVVQIGLHFNLTEGMFLSDSCRACFTLPELLVKTHLRMVSASLVEQEFLAQLERFIQVMGRYPDFIDGHQHVHQFPVIRSIVLKEYECGLRAHKVAIRSTYPLNSLTGFQLKGTILAYSGGMKLAAELKKRGIPHNPCFAGVYDFSPDADYRSLFCQWLQQVPDNTLIMCHPGEGQDDQDSIAPARQMELAYFASDAFVEDCITYRVQSCSPY